MSKKSSPRKKNSKPFLVDKISEDSFFENLLLGFPKFLKESPFVSSIFLDRFPPASIMDVQFWEYANVLALPEDLRNFYLSTNGISFTYKFRYEKHDRPQDCGDDFATTLIGGIEINPIQHLTRLNNNEVTYATESGLQVAPPQSKIFILQKVDEINSVVLAQFKPQQMLSIWLYCKNRNFFFLCKDFRTYLLMALAHGGVPGWQFQVLNVDMPEWSKEMLEILAPDLIMSKNQKDMGGIEQNCNFLNVDVFRIAETEDDVKKVQIREGGSARVKTRDLDVSARRRRSAKSTPRSVTNKNKK